jgi:SAM-dependent methyltransferase
VNIYHRCLLPALTDCACGLKAIRRARERIVPRARGRVLEVGMGSGSNIDYLDPKRVASYAGIDPNGGMLERIEHRRSSRPFAMAFGQGVAEDLPFGDACFDTVLVTFVFCSVADPLRGLAEARRVLRPGGRLLFAEHVAAPDARVRRWQDRLTPLWRRLAGGCELNRDFPALLSRLAWRPEYVFRGYLGRPRFVSYVVEGMAGASAPLRTVSPGTTWNT